MNNEDNDGGGGNHDLWLGVAMAVCVIGGWSLVKGAGGGGGLKKETRDLIGKKYIVTGANSGIGKATAAALANRGATVIMGCRNTAAGEEARQSIIDSAPGCDPTEVRVKSLDISSFRSIRQFVADVQQEIPSGVQCLVNNAGALIPTYQEKSGLELTLLTNYYGPLYLTTLLLPVLSKEKEKEKGLAPGGSGRVVNVCSRLEKGHTWGEEDIAGSPTGLLSAAQADKYSYMVQYGNSKFLQLLATRGQGEAYRKDNVVVHAVTPGMVHTGLAGSVLWSPLAWLSQPIQRLLLRTPEQGAAAVVYAATASLPGSTTGKYWTADKAGKCTEESGSEQSQSLRLAAALLQSSQKQLTAAVSRETGAELG